MRDSEFTARLRSGADEVAATANLPAPDTVRRRGDRRRRRTAAMSGVLAMALGVGGGGAAYASLGHAGPGASRTSSGSVPRNYCRMRWRAFVKWRGLMESN